MYDRINHTTRLVSLNDVAQRTRFYEAFIDVETARKSGHPQDLGAIEREYQRWENALKSSTLVAERVAAGGGATLEERKSMALAIAVQLIRTPVVRAALVNAVSEGMTEEFMKYLREANPGLAAQVDGKYVLRPTDDYIPSLLHTMFVWETGSVAHIAATLFHYIWVVGSNLSGAPLYTSDDPVALIMRDATPAEQEAAARGEPGVALADLISPNSRRAFEIAFPLSPRLALLMYHPDQFPELHEHQGHTLLMGATTVERLNEAQAGRCDRHVFGLDGDFSVAARVLDLRPE
jgi:hypothetical protein